jgi:hypothetical protein
VLVIAPCRSACDWAATGSRHEGSPLFACAGCGSEWTAAEPWAPRQADGTWPPGVREALEQG